MVWFLRHLDLAHCAACDLHTNLWLCLVCGSLGCGRKQWDASGVSGGNGHALQHFQDTGHGVACKLGTVTPEGTAGWLDSLTRAVTNKHQPLDLMDRHLLLYMRLWTSRPIPQHAFSSFRHWCRQSREDGEEYGGIGEHAWRYEITLSSMTLQVHH